MHHSIQHLQGCVNHTVAIALQVWCLESDHWARYWSSQYLDIALPTGQYRIAGNFRMVQIFAFFTDRLAAAKIRTTKISMYSTLHVSTIASAYYITN